MSNSNLEPKNNEPSSTKGLDLPNKPPAQLPKPEGVGSREKKNGTKA